MAPKRTFANAFRSSFDAKSDIIMSIRPEHMNNIASGVKNHEYRKYLLPNNVKRIWFYTSYPASHIEYVALIGPGRKPGEVPEDGGLGNDEFNAGRKVSKFGYPIIRLWKLTKPLQMQQAKAKGVLKAPPQKYNYVGRELIEGWPVQSMQCVLDRRTKKVKAQDAGSGVGKGMEAKDKEMMIIGDKLGEYAQSVRVDGSIAKYGEEEGVVLGVMPDALPEL